MSADPMLDSRVAGQPSSVDDAPRQPGPPPGFPVATAAPITTIATLAVTGRNGHATPPHKIPLSRARAEAPASASLLGTSLEPVLRQVCGGRLSEINWFRTDWQRGGAVTGYAAFRDEQNRLRDVVVKLPVPPSERHWLVMLQPFRHIVPTVYAHGEALGGYDFAWVVMERLSHGPLGAAWEGREFDLLAEAVGRFYAAARDVPAVGEPMSRDWEKLCHLAREAVRDNNLPHAQRWRGTLKKTQRKLKHWLKVWNARPIDGWCHGDLHLGNAMSRDPAPQGPALLFDFAQTRVGHWVEDAIYFEHLYWARKDRLAGRKLCKQIADERKRHHLPVDSRWPQLAQIKRSLLAMSAPAQLRHDGDRHHLLAALEVLEAAVR
ncbi:MAG: aminoglycoside phosphotransferase family protein [Phycisphaeraceae bacterium]